MARLLALLILSEAAHIGLFVSIWPLAPGVGLGAVAIGSLMGAHYLADALAKGPMGFLAARWGPGAFWCWGRPLASC
ncbi:hypothetical protein ACFP81_09610 [Deinococcus lacus]|uniref:Uncharacterized protein n=1 Tax=Deinococcus lacus TaxID=392561 RepID=A0ABW1YFC3_9DEIO